MSDVTGIILITSCLEQPTTDDDNPGLNWMRVQEWLVQHGFDELKFVDSLFGGTKDSQLMVAGAGLNGFYLRDEFRSFVSSLSWREPQNVVLVMQNEHEDVGVYRPRHDSIARGKTSTLGWNETDEAP